MFVINNWVASSTKNGPRGLPSNKTLRGAPQGEPEISSFTGQPPSMETISTPLDCLQNSLNALKSSDLHPKDHSIQIFINASNIGWGPHLNQHLIKGL